jgi:chromosome segregation ATPase
MALVFGLDDIDESLDDERMKHIPCDSGAFHTSPNVVRRLEENHAKEIVKYQRDLDAKDLRITDLNRDLAAKDLRIAKLQGLFVGQNAEIAKIEGLLDASITMGETEIAKLQGLFVGQNAEIAKFQGDLAAKNTEIAKFQSVLDTKDAEIAKFQSVLGTKDAEIAIFQGDLAAKNAEIAKLTKELERMKKENTDTDKKITWRDEVIKDLNVKMNHLESAKKSSDRDFSLIQGRLLDVADKNKELTEKCSALEKQLSVTTEERQNLLTERDNCKRWQVEANKRAKKAEDELGAARQQYADLMLQYSIEDHPQTWEALISQIVEIRTADIILDCQTQIARLKEGSRREMEQLQLDVQELQSSVPAVVEPTMRARIGEAADLRLQEQIFRGRPQDDSKKIRAIQAVFDRHEHDISYYPRGQAASSSKQDKISLLEGTPARSVGYCDESDFPEFQHADFFRQTPSTVSKRENIPSCESKFGPRKLTPEEEAQLYEKRKLAMRFCR